MIVPFERDPNTITDAKEWKPIEALKALVKLIEKGEVSTEQIAIIYWNSSETRNKDLSYFVAGLNFSDYIALLHVALSRGLEDWRNG